MAKRIIECQVSDEYVLGAGVVVGAAGSHDDVVLRLTFGEMWIGLNLYATFRDARGENPTFAPILPSMLVDGEVMVYDVPVPAAAKRHQGQMMLTLTGYSIVDGVQEDSATNTATTYFRVLPSDFALFDDGSVDATIAQQMQNEINKHARDVAESIGVISETVDGFGDTMEAKLTEQDGEIEAFGERVTELEDRAGRGEFKGEDGRGVKSITTKYAAGSTSQRQPDDSEFIYTVASAAASQTPDNGFLWIKKIYTFTDDTTKEIVTPVRFGKTGKTGPKGDPFGVSKVYHSIDEMNAGFATDGLLEGSFVMINTGNVEDPDNAKVYVKGADGYSFMVDLSGSPGIKGDPGYTPIKGKDYFTPEDISEIAQEVSDEAVGELDAALDNIIAIQESFMIPDGDEVSY